MYQIKDWLKHNLSQGNINQIRRMLYPFLRYLEFLFWGSKIRETILVYLLDKYYQSKFRREWVYVKETPHFFDHRMGFFSFIFGNENFGPYSYFRAFYTAEIINNGDSLLDIGCGDGVFTKRFYSRICSHIDAIDINMDAIKYAKNNNSSLNISYKLSNAVTDPFPCDTYDMIVWDGAIGHFSYNDCQIVLEKIGKSLSFKGIFAGSESLGHEESDHQQYFEKVGDLFELFTKYFKFVEIRTMKYPLKGGNIRREAYWRCSNDCSRLSESHWMTNLSKKRDDASNRLNP